MVAENNLHVQEKRNFVPRPVKSFEGKTVQDINVAMTADLVIQGRRYRNQTFLVINSAHDLIVGRKWFSDNEVLIDCRQRRLLFPSQVPEIEDPTERVISRQSEARQAIYRRIQELEARPPPNSPTNEDPALELRPPLRPLQLIQQHKTALDNPEVTKKQVQWMDRQLAGPVELPPSTKTDREIRKDAVRQFHEIYSLEDNQGRYRMKRDCIG